jgi:arabinose-5-phosphate isomerase
MVTADDVVLAISNSGETDEVVGLLPFIKRFGVKLISLTGNPESTLASAADVNLDVVCGEDACPMGIVPTSSTTATLALGDALAVALLGRRGFREEDFAAYHPKGALGKKLLTRVGDLMHTGPHVPAVGSDAPMSDVVVEISSKRFGFTTVLDSEGRMLGIVTDGDLRRGIEQHGQAFFGMSAGEAMTRNPKTVTAEMLAANALAVMQAHAITALVVADEGGRAEGVVHIHDILKAGIV